MSSTAMPGDSKDQAAGVCIDNYRLLKKLGEGRLGSVYLAEDTLSPAQARVAVKVLSKQHSMDPESLACFKSDTEAATRLKHPNIVRTLSVRESRAGDGTILHYCVMEYCEGTRLDELVKHDGFLSCREAITVIMQIARGLQYAHEQRFIHGDIKPAHICVTPQGEAKLLGMELSRNISDPGQAQKTAAGLVPPAPHYISPEQARSAKRLDHRTDIYSLGATFYCLLTGQPPFDGSPGDIITKHVTTTAPDPKVLRPEIPDELSQVVQKMLAKEPAARPRDCAALLAALEPISRGELPMKPSTESAQAVLEARRQKEEGDALFMAQVRRCVKYSAIAVGAVVVLWLFLPTLRGWLGFQQPDLKKREEISALRKAADRSVEREDWKEAKEKFGKILELAEPEMLRNSEMQEEYRHATKEMQNVTAKLDWEAHRHEEEKVKAKKEKEDSKKVAESTAAEKLRAELAAAALATKEKQRREKEDADRAAEEKKRKEKEEADRAAEEMKRKEKEEADRAARAEQAKEAKKKRDALRAECLDAAQTALAALERIEQKAAGGAQYPQYIDVYQTEWPRVQRFLEMPELKKLREDLKDSLAEKLWKQMSAAGDSLVKGQGEWREKIQAVKEKDFDRQAWDGEVFGHVDDAKTALEKFKKME